MPRHIKSEHVSSFPCGAKEKYSGKTAKCSLNSVFTREDSDFSELCSSEALHTHSTVCTTRSQYKIHATSPVHKGCANAHWNHHVATETLTRLSTTPSPSIGRWRERRLGGGINVQTSTHWTCQQHRQFTCHQFIISKRNAAPLLCVPLQTAREAGVDSDAAITAVAAWL